MASWKTPTLIFALGAALMTAGSALSADGQDKLSLAREVVRITHRQDLTRDVYAKELRASMTFCRNDPKCQADLDRAIIAASIETSIKDADDLAELFARRLTQSQLQAMLKFYSSPEGQAIVAVESDMSNDLARMGLQSVRKAQQSINRSFCPSHPEVCVNDVGRHPALPPKS